MATAEQIRNRKNVLAYIEANPKQHYQGSWWSDSEGEWDSFESVEDINICGSTMCIAGTAVFLNKTVEQFKKFVFDVQDKDDDTWVQSGAEILGLDENEALDLFNDLSDERALNALRVLAAEEPV